MFPFFTPEGVSVAIEDMSKDQLVPLCGTLFRSINIVTEANAALQDQKDEAYGVSVSYASSNQALQDRVAELEAQLENLSRGIAQRDHLIAQQGKFLTRLSEQVFPLYDDLCAWRENQQP